MLPVRKNYQNYHPTLFRDSGSLIDRFLNDDFWNFNSIFSDEFPRIESDRYYDKDANEYVISLSLPGFTKDDISVDIENDMLVIKGEIKNEKTKKFISQNKFSYSYSTNNLDIDTIAASMENGILEIRSKPIKELNITKKIEVK